MVSSSIVGSSVCAGVEALLDIALSFGSFGGGALGLVVVSVDCAGVETLGLLVMLLSLGFGSFVGGDMSLVGTLSAVTSFSLVEAFNFLFISDSPCIVWITDDIGGSVRPLLLLLAVLAVLVVRLPTGRIGNQEDKMLVIIVEMAGTASSNR